MNTTRTNLVNKVRKDKKIEFYIGPISHMIAYVNYMLLFITKEHFPEKESVLDEMEKFVQSGMLNAHCQAFSPVRSKPRRTYDYIHEEFTAEGAHGAFALQRILKEPVLAEALLSYGKDSGMFDDIRLKKLGKGLHDPIQLMIKKGGTPKNIIDLGYGVSQVLPLLIQSLLMKKKALLLMQQPEVHLHPRAQAELGTFLAQLSSLSIMYYVIETHSDYIVDRARMTVSNGELQQRDIALYYTERTRNTARLELVEIDGQGNIINAPSGYREFFLEEEKKNLMR